MGERDEDDERGGGAPRSQRPSQGGERRSKRRALGLLAIAGAVLLLLSISFSMQRILGTDRAEEPSAGASASAARVDAEQQRAALMDRIAQKRVELDRMVGRTMPVPAGTFEMGADDGNLNERPKHTVKVEGFEIDEFEVSVAAFQLCVGAGKCEPPTSGVGCNWGQPDRRNHPVNCVTWEQAKAFCGWAAKRLPTESEWAFAARGLTGNRYPWGNNEPTDEPCWQRGPTDGGPALGTCPTASSDRDMTLLGIRAMGGNVREWIDAPFCPYSRPDCETDTVVLRGGAWTDADPLGVRAALRNGKSRTYRSETVGFRCARDALARDGG